jgi:hypothetical protein
VPQVDQASGGGDVPHAAANELPVGTAGQLPEFDTGSRLHTSSRVRPVERQAPPRLPPLKPDGEPADRDGKNDQPDDEWPAVPGRGGLWPTGLGRLNGHGLERVENSFECGWRLLIAVNVY